jgi:hypothetical protein
MCSTSILYIINSIILEMSFIRLPLENSNFGINSTYIRTQTPEKYRKLFSKLVNSIQDDFNQHKESKAHALLAGQMKHEYLVSLPDELHPFIGDVVDSFAENNNQVFNALKPVNEGVDIQLINDATWINFQQKYEYNPIHDHSGVLSWVYYHKVPYLLEKEDKCFNDPAKEKFNGRFVFWPEVGYHVSLDIDNRHEGTFIMFPSTLHHAVYPFYTSDEYRITIAGNVGVILKN